MVTANNPSDNHQPSPPGTYRRTTILLVVALCALLFWLIEAFIHAVLFHQGAGFLDQLIHPSGSEQLLRLLVICFFILLGLYFRHIVTRMKQDHGQLKKEVAERHKAEQAYKHLLARTQLILNSAGEGIFGLDADGKVTFVNPAALKLSGYQAQELLGRNIHEILHHSRADGFDHPQEDCPTYTALLNGETRLVMNDVFWGKDGKELPVEYTSTPIREDGQATGVVVVFRDISQRQQAETDLKRERDFIAALLDTIGALVLVLDREGRIIRFNPACEKITGYSFQEVRGTFVWDFLLTPEEIAPVKEVVGKLVAGDFPCEFENLWLTREGRPRLIAWSNTALVGEDGAPAFIIATGIDITERRRSELVRQEAMDFLENVIENSADAIGIVDRRGRFITWNKAAQEVIGYSFEELKGKSAFDLYADKDELVKMLRKLRRDGYVRRYEIHLKKKDGSIIPFTLSISLLYDRSREAIGSITVARDLSDIRDTLGQLQRVNEQLRQEIAEREQVETTLQEVNEKLKNLVQEVEQRNRQITLLNELSDLLQACFTCEEAYAGIAQSAASLFEGYVGALLVLNAHKNLLESVAVWGGPLAGEEVFTPDDCWALRRGVIHVVQDAHSGLPCRHLSARPGVSSMCLPLVAQGETLGMLLLQSLPPGPGHEAGKSPPGRIPESTQRLAVNLAKNISLALANLRLRETLFRQAVRDPLTGLYNRRYMEETLERELHRARRRQAPLGLMILDMDHFKIFNDAFGHRAGDTLLAMLSGVLQGAIRRDDVVCRYGGEEFVIIMPEASLEVACQRAESLREQISRLQVMIGNQELDAVTASFGVAAFPQHGQTGEDLLRAADRALFLAKEQGRNRVLLAETLEGDCPKEERLKMNYKQRH